MSLHKLTAGDGYTYVVRDVAVTLEAFLVLDDRLEQVGLLTQHDRPPATLSLEERRLVASQCARAATWYATSNLADQAVPRATEDAPVVYGPVYLVGSLSDLAPAQRRLATFLRPTNANDSFYAGEPEISADAARHIVASQLFICANFTKIAGQSSRTQKIAREFAERGAVLKEIQPQIRYLVDDQKHPSSKPRMWQQGELTTALMRMKRQSTDLSLSHPELLELASATHEVTHNLARVLRRELLRDTSNLRIADPFDSAGKHRVYRGSSLEARLTDLINHPAPASPVSRFDRPVQRMALRTTLDMTATVRVAPSPFPAPREQVASGYLDF